MLFRSEKNLVSRVCQMTFGVPQEMKARKRLESRATYFGFFRLSFVLSTKKKNGLKVMASNKLVAPSILKPLVNISQRLLHPLKWTEVELLVSVQTVSGDSSEPQQAHACKLRPPKGPCWMVFSSMKDQLKCKEERHVCW